MCLSFSLSLSIYIYIYTCIYVSVDKRIYTHRVLGSCLALGWLLPGGAGARERLVGRAPGMGFELWAWSTSHVRKGQN